MDWAIISQPYSKFINESKFVIGLSTIRLVIKILAKNRLLAKKKQ